MGMLVELKCDKLGIECQKTARGGGGKYPKRKPGGGGREREKERWLVDQRTNEICFLYMDEWLGGYERRERRKEEGGTRSISGP